MRKLLPQERLDLALTIAGEIAPYRSPYGTRRNREEVAAILRVIENREVLRNKNLSQVVHQPGQFSTWGTPEGRKNATDNYALFKEDINKAVDDYFDDYLTSPTPDVTHYYSPEGMKDRQPPDWAADLAYTTQIGPHVFGYMEDEPQRMAVKRAKKNFSVYGQPSNWPVSAVLDRQRAMRSLEKAGVLTVGGKTVDPSLPRDRAMRELPATTPISPGAMPSPERFGSLPPTTKAGRVRAMPSAERFGYPPPTTPEMMIAHILGRAGRPGKAKP